MFYDGWLSKFCNSCSRLRIFFCDQESTFWPIGKNVLLPHFSPLSVMINKCIKSCDSKSGWTTLVFLVWFTPWIFSMVYPFHLGGLTLLILDWKKVKRNFGKNCTEYLASPSLCTVELQGNQDVAKPRNASFEILYWRALQLRWEVWLALYLEMVHLCARSKICFSLHRPFKNTTGLPVFRTCGGFFAIGIFYFILEQFLHWILLWNDIYASILRAKV